MWLNFSLMIAVIQIEVPSCILFMGMIMRHKGKMLSIHKVAKMEIKL